MPSSGIDGRDNTNYLHNIIAPRFGLQVDWDRQRCFDLLGQEYWVAILYVNGRVASQGQGLRIGHAKDAASYHYLVTHGYVVPAPF